MLAVVLVAFFLLLLVVVVVVVVLVALFLLLVVVWDPCRGQARLPEPLGPSRLPRAQGGPHRLRVAVELAGPPIFMN